MSEVESPGPETLRPGDIMIGSIGGFVPGLLPVAFGQLLLAGQERRRTAKHWWHFRHVAVVVGAGEEGLAPPMIVQAMPSGAELVPLPARNWTAEYLYLRPMYPDVMGYRHGGEFVANRARQYVGRKYSFADYAALAWHRWRNGGEAYRPVTERDWLDRYVASSQRMICSQLADQALTDAGWHTFDDGRLPQDVRPAEFACKLLSMPGQHLRPGRGGWTDNAPWPSCCQPA